MKLNGCATCRNAHFEHGTFIFFGAPSKIAIGNRHTLSTEFRNIQSTLRACTLAESVIGK